MGLLVDDTCTNVTSSTVKSVHSKSISETAEAHDTVFETAVSSVTLEFFTSVILELVFFLNTLMQPFFRYSSES